MSCTITEMEVTPSIAEEWLKDALQQGLPLNLERVEKFAADITNGNWEYCFETIEISKNGKLINGRHRLHAIILADKPLRCGVTFYRD
jgi:hypothetical protein